jgi:hypothetical protein
LAATTHGNRGDLRFDCDARPAGRFRYPTRRWRWFLGQGSDELLRRITSGFRGSLGLLGYLASLSFIDKLIMVKIGIAFGREHLIPRLLKALFQPFIFGTKFGDGLALSVQRLDRLVLGEFRMTDLGLKVAHDALGFRQRPLSFVTSRSLGREGSLSPLQAAARGGRWRGDAAMGWRLVGLISAQDGHWNIAILDKTAAVQAATKSVTHTNRLFRPFRLRPISLRFAQQSKGLSHLRLGFVTWSSRLGRTGFGRLRQPVLVRLAEREIES